MPKTWLMVRLKISRKVFLRMRLKQLKNNLKKLVQR